MPRVVVAGMRNGKLFEKLLLALALAACATLPFALGGCDGSSHPLDMSAPVDQAVPQDLSPPQPDLTNVDLGEQD